MDCSSVACACRISKPRTPEAESVLHPWISESSLGWRFGLHRLHASAPAPWNSVRKEPDVLDAQIAIAKSPDSMGLRRCNAVLRIGATGDLRACEFLALAYIGHTSRA